MSWLSKFFKKPEPVKIGTMVVSMTLPTPPAGLIAADCAKRINAIRSEFSLSVDRPNLKPLETDTDLVREAQRHCELMALEGFFGHRGFEERITSAGFSIGSENIGYGTTEPKQMIEIWMNSKPHRSNILHPKFDFFGVGFYQKYWCVLFAQE